MKAEIRKGLRECGVWEYAENGRIYTTAEFIAELGPRIPEGLQSLLVKHVARLQYYFDERIIEYLDKNQL